MWLACRIGYNRKMGVGLVYGIGYNSCKVGGVVCLWNRIVVKWGGYRIG